MSFIGLFKHHHSNNWQVDIKFWWCSKKYAHKKRRQRETIRFI